MNCGIGREAHLQRSMAMLLRCTLESPITLATAGTFSTLPVASQARRLRGGEIELWEVLQSLNLGSKEWPATARIGARTCQDSTSSGVRGLHDEAWNHQGRGSGLMLRALLARVNMQESNLQLPCQWAAQRMQQASLYRF